MVVYTTFLSDARVRREARALAGHGFTVKVFSLKEDNRPRREIWNGIEVRRLPVRKYRGDSPLRYVISYGVFFVWAFLALIAECVKHVPEYVHVHTMPDFLVFSTIVPKLLGSRIVLDMHDVMPELYMEKFGVSERHWLIRLLTGIERSAVRFSDKAITVDHPRVTLLERHGVNTSKITVVMNMPVPEVFKAQPLLAYPSGKFTLGYHGTVARRFGLDKVLEAVCRLHSEIPSLRLKLIGGGDYIDGIRAKIEELGIADIVDARLKAFSVSDLPELLRDVDVGLACYELGAATRTMLPVKMFEYIALGKPVIAIRSPTIEYYFPANSVIYYDGTMESLSNAIKYAYDNPNDMKKRVAACRKVLVRHHWNIQMRNLLRVYGIRTAGCN